MKTGILFFGLSLFLVAQTVPGADDSSGGGLSVSLDNI